MTKIRLTGFIDVPEARHASVHAALPAHISLTRQEPGCLSFEVTPDPNMAGRLHVNELFVDKTAFEAHQSRTQASPWADVTKGIPRHYELTEIAE